MTNANDVRRAHKLLDYVSQGRAVLDEEIELLRSFLPELPKQKTLEEITEHVRNAWVGASGNEWAGNSYNAEITLESWLGELYVQLQGLKDTPATVPALPAGMRIAEHENFGRVVVSPEVGIDKCHEIFYLDPGMSSGTDISEVEPDSLTFIDSEPGHPEFLETEADYQNAPEGTIVAAGAKMPYIKGAGLGAEHLWRSAMDGTSTSFDMSIFPMSLEKKRVLRWGWAK